MPSSADLAGGHRCHPTCHDCSSPARRHGLAGLGAEAATPLDWELPSSPARQACLEDVRAGRLRESQVDPTWSSGTTAASRDADQGHPKERPGWELFATAAPTANLRDVAARADRFIAGSGIDGDVLAFSSGHIIRMIAARWLGLPPGAGRFFCRPASVGVLGFEHRTGTSRSSACGTTSLNE